MKKGKYEFLNSSMLLINVVMVMIPFTVCWYRYYCNVMGFPFYRRGNWAVVGLFVVLYIAFGKLYDGFKIPLLRISEMVYSQSVAALVSDGIMYIVIFLLMRRLPNPLPLVAVFAVQTAMSAAWSMFAHRWYFELFPPKRTAIVYDTRQGMERLVDEYGLEKRFDVVKILSVQECIDNLDELYGMEAVFLSGIHSRERNVILKHCIFNDISVYVIPRIGDVIMSGAKKIHMFHLPMLNVGRYNPSFFYLFVKRLMDILLAGIALIIASPIMLVTAIIIKLTDGGPVFYSQQRMTKDGKLFNIHKFRSMRVDAEKDGVARLSTGDSDNRITPVGRIIRKVRIDELPQLLDILSGNLTIVGPRPERPEIAAQYQEKMPEFALRLQAKAGLTGYAQVYGKYSTTPYDKLQMDLMYIANPSIIQDVQIIFATVKILFMPESTEGVKEGQTTAETFIREKEIA